MIRAVCDFPQISLVRPSSSSTSCLLIPSQTCWRLVESQVGYKSNRPADEASIHVDVEERNAVLRRAAPRTVMSTTVSDFESNSYISDVRSLEAPRRKRYRRRTAMTGGAAQSGALDARRAANHSKDTFSRRFCDAPSETPTTSTALKE